jgi:hypothetical protein
LGALSGVWRRVKNRKKRGEDEGVEPFNIKATSMRAAIFTVARSVIFGLETSFLEISFFDIFPYHIPQSSSVIASPKNSIFNILLNNPWCLSSSYSRGFSSHE